MLILSTCTIYKSLKNVVFEEEMKASKFITPEIAFIICIREFNFILSFNLILSCQKLLFWDY